jgi:hypothetical protein
MKKPTITIPVPEMSGLLQSVWHYLLAAVLLAPSFLWIAVDHRVWPWDQAWYAEVSVDLWYWLNHSPVRWFQTAADQLNLKPPAIVWFGQFFVPMKGVFGSIEMSLLVSIVLAQFVLLLILFRIGGIMSRESRLIAVAGVLFAGGAQLFVGVSHQFFVEAFQAVAVAWAYLVALRAPEWSKSRILLHLAANFAFGLLVKASTPAYCWLPWLYCVFVLLRTPSDIPFFSEWKSRSFRAFAIATCALVVLCLLWYLRHFADVLKHVRDASSGEIALDYGARGTIFQKLKIWIPIVGRSFFSPSLGWACAVALVVAAVAVLRGSPSRLKQAFRLPVIAVLSIVQVASLLFLFSTSIAVDARYAYAMLPCLTIVFMTLCAALPRKALVAMLLLCGVRWAIVNHAAFAPGTELENQSEWLYQPHRDRGDFEDLTRVVHLTSTLADRYSIIAVEDPRLNANSAAFFAAKNRLITGVRSYYTSLGYAERNLEAAMRRIEDFHVPYVITLATVSQEESPNFVNVVSRPVLERIEHDSRFTLLPLFGEGSILVFRFSPTSIAPVATAPVSAQAGKPPSALTVIPPGIAHATVEKRGRSSLGWVNSALPEQVRGGRTFLVRGGVLASCIGWAYDDLLKSTPEDVWIELTHTRTKEHYYWPASRYDRPELAEAVKVPSVKRSGINCQQVKYTLPAGTYTTKIYQVNGGTAIVSDLNSYEPSPTIVVK